MARRRRVQSKHRRTAPRGGCAARLRARRTGASGSIGSIGAARASRAARGASERLAIEIRKARRAAGLTQAELSARLKKSPSWVAGVESNRRLLFLTDLQAIADALAMDVLELLARARRNAR
jgi:ribosome-binding protein aMBF1 (putative translation factor)